jgi:diguanylate cyclase (GGDEF)-like protein/PAS domain S-box-containing protein
MNAAPKRTTTREISVAPAEAGAADREFFAAKLMEHLAIAAFVLDRSGRVLIWNKACARLTGVPAADMIGSTDHWKALYAEKRPCLADLLLSGRREDASALYEAWSDTEVNPDGLSAENWCVMPHLGRRCYLAFDVGPIYDENGRVIAVVETMRDLTSHKRMEAELETLAGVDALTAIPNRRAFDTKLLEEWRRAKRHGDPLSLLMIDVDYFKQYNDRNGHPAGDVCLKTIANCLIGQTLRAGDLAARFGGEEFAILLPQTPSEGAVAVAERIRRAIEDVALPHNASPVSPFVTVSIGATTSCDISTMETLVAQADAALYDAKRGGRNRVERHAGGDDSSRLKAS